MAELLALYTPALHDFLVETRRVPPELADDILQDFVADKILARNIVGRADPERGKFRSFLVRSLSNYTSTKLQKEYRERARALGLDQVASASATNEPDTDPFDRRWVETVVKRALASMEADCRERGRLDLWELFRLRMADPILLGAEPVSYEEIVSRFSLETPRQAINLLVTAKRAFLRHLRLVVGLYVGDEDLIDEEIAALREIVLR